MELLLFPENSKITYESSSSTEPIKIVKFVHSIDIEDENYMCYIPGNLFITRLDKVFIEQIKLENKFEESVLSNCNYFGGNIKLVSKLINGIEPTNQIDLLCMKYRIESLIVFYEPNLLNQLEKNLVTSLKMIEMSKIKQIFKKQLNYLIGIGYGLIGLNELKEEAEYFANLTIEDRALMSSIILIAKGIITNLEDCKGISFSNLNKDFLPQNQLSNLGFLLKEMYIDNKPSVINLLTPSSIISESKCIGGSIKIKGNHTINIFNSSKDEKKEFEMLITDNKAIIFNSKGNYSFYVCLLLELNHTFLINKQVGKARKKIIIPKELQYATKEEKLIFLEQWTKTNG